MEKVIVKINGYKGDGDWAKEILGVSANASTGHDWDGSWLTAGISIDLEIGAMYIECLKERKSTSYLLRLVLPNGHSRKIATSVSTGWAQEMRATAREWLALSNEQRIVRAANDRIKQIQGMSTEKQSELAGEITERREWIARFGGEIDARSVAIEQIHALMAEYGIAANEL